MDYIVWATDWRGEDYRIVDFHRLEYTRVLNDVGVLTVVMPEMAIWNDGRIVVWRRGEIEGVYFIARVRREWDTRRMVVTAMSPTWVLQRRIIREASFTGIPADIAVRQIIEDAIGPGAAYSLTATGYVRILTASGRGNAVTVDISYVDALHACRKIVDAAGGNVWFDIYPVDNSRLVADVRVGVWGRDRRRDLITFSPDLDTAWDLVDVLDYRSYIMKAYALGRGQHERRVATAERERVETPFLYGEAVVNAASTPDDALSSEAEALLRRRGVKHAQSARIGHTWRTEYRRHWDLGDVIAVTARDFRYDAVIRGVHVTVGDAEKIEPMMVPYDG